MGHRATHCRQAKKKKTAEKSAAKWRFDYFNFPFMPFTFYACFIYSGCPHLWLKMMLRTLRWGNTLANRKMCQLETRLSAAAAHPVRQYVKPNSNWYGVTGKQPAHWSLKCWIVRKSVDFLYLSVRKSDRSRAMYWCICPFQLCLRRMGPSPLNYGPFNS